jgi:hypothetical protein
MSAEVQSDRIAMSQKERDVLTIMRAVLRGERTQAEAADLLKLTVRQVRRIQRKLEAGGDRAIIHGLCGKPSNHQPDHDLKEAALNLYKERYADFGPTFAAEKLKENHHLEVCPVTLRRWLIDDELWFPKRKRKETHRSRRPRRACFGELLQFDASIHDWLEGRGEDIVLITLIDDATSIVMARFYPAATTLAHMDLMGRWIRKHGRPLGVYTDRHSIFMPQDKGRALTSGETQFGRAMSELDIELIWAHSPQAKGRVERSFGTAQDRWVKELRLASVTTQQEANETLMRIVPAHNRKFAVKPRSVSDAHRELGPRHNLDAILSEQVERSVSNDYVVRLNNRHYQLLPPAWPGLRKGKVIIEERLGGTRHIRFEGRYLSYEEIAAEGEGATGRTDEFIALAADASAQEKGSAPTQGAERSGVQPTGGRSGCAPAEPYPPDGDSKDSAKPMPRPDQDHPWRKPFKPQK